MRLHPTLIWTGAAAREIAGLALWLAIVAPSSARAQAAFGAWGAPVQSIPGVAGPTVGWVISSAPTGSGPSPAVAAAPGAPAPPMLPPPESVGMFEVVPLKYADVSEIVGLLTAGQSIRPNDNFAPEEPAFGSGGPQGSFPGSGFGSGLNGGFGGAMPGLGPGLPPGGLSVEPLGQTVDDGIGVDRWLNAIVLRG